VTVRDMPLPSVAAVFVTPVTPREHLTMARALNIRTIDAIKPHKTKRQELPDGTVTGLYLVVQSSGAKAWAVRYRYAGKSAKLTLGPYPRLGLAEARAAARETLGIVSEGNDPTADLVTLKRLKRGPVVDGNRTFEAVKKRFIESQRAKGRRTVAAIESILDRDATPHWKSRQITSISAADVVERIEVIVARGAPVAAARFRAWVSKLFSYAVKAQLCPDNPVRLTESPVDAKSRERSAGSMTKNWCWCGRWLSRSVIRSARRCSCCS
jgi:hypothetical protein